jgi:two-component sensor histidine kinase
MGLHSIPPSIQDVFITHELSARLPKNTDYFREKIALQDLASRMADQPEDILPRFVDLALEMTGGVSAGLSLYEQQPGNGVFRWKYLRGALASFEGATTPRDFSPCGITLDQCAPVLCVHPERFYDWIAEADITIPEVLLVPLFLGGSAPLGTLWIVSDRPGHLDSGHARAMTELASFVGIALRMLRSEQRLQNALQEQEMLAKEMSHRVKNLFAITDSMIRLSARHATSKQELAEGLSGRLHALARAHALVRRNFAKTEAVTSNGFGLADLIRAIVEPHEYLSLGDKSRFFIDGPAIECSEQATNSVALVFHELATNAAKYGALTVDEGCVDITWRVEEGNVAMRWREHGGPGPTSAPATHGFGSELAKTTVERHFGGSLAYEWQAGGLVVNLVLSLARL